MTSTTAQPILPKPQPVPVYLIPVAFASNIHGQIAQSASIRQSLSTIVPSAPPPPPIQLLKAKRRRIPILIDQRSLKKNLQSNKQCKKKIIR